MRPKRRNGPRHENAVLSWAKAIWGGLKDTAQEAVREGRRGAEEAYDDGWRRFDEKTRFRRRRDE
jgi:hypothetical protein